jgi:hypothetical protein
VQIGDSRSYLVHRAPRGEFDTASWIGRSSGHLHDEPDDLPVQPAIVRVVEAPGHRGCPGRLQPVARNGLPQLSIALGGVLAWLPRRQIDGDEDQRGPHKHRTVCRKESLRFLQMPAISHGRHHHDHPGIGERRRCRTLSPQVVQKDREPVLGEPRSDMVGNAPGLAVPRGVEQKYGRISGRAAVDLRRWSSLPSLRREGQGGAGHSL